MPQYMVANYLPDDFDPSAVTEAMIEEIHALNRELIAAGARKFACGISPASNAKTVRKQPDGTVLVTDGPYTETKEHMGGFWILEAADMDEALAWARKAAISCDAAGEVRELLFYPDPKGATESSGRSDYKMNEPAQGSALAPISVQRPMSDASSSSPLDSSGYLRISPSLRRRNIWLLFTIPTTTTRPSRPKRWSAISTCSTKR